MRLKCGQTQTANKEGISAQRNGTGHQAHILGDMEDFSDLFLLTPFSLQCTKQMVVSMSDYS